MPDSLDPPAIAQLFYAARSRNAWSREPLPDRIWRDLYDMLKMGPTSANVSPARFLFCTSEAAKSRVAKHMSATNASKSLAASAIVIVAHDLNFTDHMPQLFPHNPGARHWFSDPQVQKDTAFRNGTLQGAYLILAARSLGLDCGPMSGFDHEALDADFFAGTAIKSNFLCALGHGEDQPLARLPRLAFEEACKIL
ncbi:malonic semialdehyde reductase [Sphingobium sp. WCS2017Hpa-17]|uniref:malonic semialdehyde reductase n=1 Tax=Sphingobium sp. WCS2017Hpa-17 TaxID=3073638 RepID=UPI00288A7984|nr:malonic semialdehyde reductase [Sphingobium sp. WCS2017Hpa-17]